VLTIGEIPFPETREYVQRVLSAERAYATDYARELGLE
jgi:soluble lytic murein transglycosylase-like protein